MYYCTKNFDQTVSVSSMIIVFFRIGISSVWSFVKMREAGHEHADYIITADGHVYRQSSVKLELYRMRIPKVLSENWAANGIKNYKWWWEWRRTLGDEDCWWYLANTSSVMWGSPHMRIREPISWNWAANGLDNYIWWCEWAGNWDSIWRIMQNTLADDCWWYLAQPYYVM